MLDVVPGKLVPVGYGSITFPDPRTVNFRVKTFGQDDYEAGYLLLGKLVALFDLRRPGHTIDYYRCPSTQLCTG